MLRSAAIIAVCFCVFFSCNHKENTGVHVIFALSPACPMTAYYLNYLDTIEQKFASQSISFEYLIACKNHGKLEIDSFKNLLPNKKVTLDIDNENLHELNIETVPAAMVFTNKKQMYYGAIDNRAYAPGKLRQVITERYLETVLNEISKQKKLSYNFQKPVGCIVE